MEPSGSDGKVSLNMESITWPCEAEETAARTVNKERARSGEAKESSRFFTAPPGYDDAASRHQPEPGPIVAASYGDARSHPLVVERSAWDDVPDTGLRARAAVLVACDDLGHPGDVDRPEDMTGDA